MKRGCAILLVLVVLTALPAACTKLGTPGTTPAQTPGATPSSTPVPTTPPDFVAIDFTGTWAVSELIDSNGQTVSPEKLSQMNADFTLEISTNGAYFLYDAQGALIGQGQYQVTQNELTLSAGGQQTVYIIQDPNTLRCEAEDGSITVMTRCEDTEEEIIDEGDTGDSDIEEEDTGESEEEASASSENTDITATPGN